MNSPYELIQLYLDYTNETESPRTYHRWTLLSAIGTLLGRQCWVPFGHWKIYPNQYVLLVGSPGARKGSSISVGKKFLAELEYPFFGPDKAAKETIWYEMARMAGQLNGEETDLLGDPDIDEDILLLDEPSAKSSSIAQMYICADEFTAFTGYGNEEFIINLTNLWDNLDSYKNPKLRSESVMVYNPTINILSGSTPENLADALPRSAFGSGFTSRLILVHGEKGKSISWPPIPNAKTYAKILHRLSSIDQRTGPIDAPESTRELLSDIYHQENSIDDRRFEYYYQRRQTHLLKLSMIHAISREDEKIKESDVIISNTILTLAEREMPLALGHFGKARTSGIANTVLEAIYQSQSPLTFRSLWKQVAADCSKEIELKEVLKNLVAADKIQLTRTKLRGSSSNKAVYLPKRAEATNIQKHKFIDLAYVTPEERID